jgi:hypothetical protein
VPLGDKYVRESYANDAKVTLLPPLSLNDGFNVAGTLGTAMVKVVGVAALALKLISGMPTVNEIAAAERTRTSVEFRLLDI